MGLSRGELSIFLLIESGLLGLSSSLVTVILAVPISYVLIVRALPALLGWVIDFQFDWAACLFVLAIGLVGALVSSLYSILWARFLNISEATQYK